MAPIQRYSLTVLPTQDSLGLWSFFFLAKMALYAHGQMAFDLTLNLIFFIYLFIPNPARFSGSRGVRWIRGGLNVALGMLLLWHDSWLPPLSYVVDFFWKAGLPTKEYIFRFLSGYAQPRAFGMLLAGLGVTQVLRRRVHLAPLVALLFLVLTVQKMAHPPMQPLDRQLSDFYGHEAARWVRLAAPSPSTPDFDVIILHVCSLSWEDLQATGLEHDPLLKQFDVLFTRFNSVSTHSTPSALRLLRALGGQVPHPALYQYGAPNSNLFQSLRAIGYRTTTAFDHDGRYSGMADQLKAYGYADDMLPVQDLPVALVSFDGSLIRDDYAVLDRWWTYRQVSGKPRAALYLNIMSLHGGSHAPGDRLWWKRSRTDLYREAFTKLSADLRRFQEKVDRSGRQAVVFFVPEHGLSLRGSTLQAPDLREIPLPAITLVPVGIKWLGSRPSRTMESPLLVEKPVSYLALGELLALSFREPVFQGNRAVLEHLKNQLPETAFLAENEKARVMENKGAFYLKMSGGSWAPIPKEAALVPSVEMP